MINKSLYFEIPVQVLSSLLLFASDSNDPRLYLAGVHVSPGRAESTNGHILGRFDREDILLAGAPDIILSTFQIKDMLKYAKGSHLVICTAGLVGNIVVDLLDYRFPDCDRVFPPTVSGEAAQLNPEYLVLFSRAARLLRKSPKNEPLVRVDHNGTDGASRVHILADESFSGLIMPMRL